MKQRPLSLTVSSILLVLVVLLGVALPLLSIGRVIGNRTAGRAPGLSPDGPRALPNIPANRGRPTAILGLAVAGLCLSVAGLVATLAAAVGLWQQKKWGFVLALVVAALGTLSALIGLIHGGLRALGMATAQSGFPGLGGGALLAGALIPSAARIVLLVAVFILLLLPASRRAIFPPPEPAAPV